MSNTIEIKIDGKKLTPEKFLEAAKSFFGLIQGVAKNITTAPVDWVVEVDKGSTIMRGRIENPSPESEQSIAVICRGVHSLRTGIHIMPYGFTKDEVRASKELASLIDGIDIQSVWIKNGQEPEILSNEIIKSADVILRGESHIAFGSIEGKIVSLSLRHAFSCTIYEPLYRREITCYLQNQKTQDEAISSLKNRAKVLAYGLIHYAKEGHPVNITADKIEVFPDQSDLPTLKEIQNIYNHYK